MLLHGICDVHVNVEVSVRLPTPFEVVKNNIHGLVGCAAIPPHEKFITHQLRSNETMALVRKGDETMDILLTSR